MDIRNADGEVAESGAEFVGLLLAPVMGQLDDGVRRFVAIAYESKREFARRIVLLAQELHAEQAGVEVERPVEILDPEHGVEKPKSIGSRSEERGVGKECVSTCRSGWREVH